jgi:hypothetical protein
VRWKENGKVRFDFGIGMQGGDAGKGKGLRVDLTAPVVGSVDE